MFGINDKTYDASILAASQELHACNDFSLFYTKLRDMLRERAKCKRFSILLYNNRLKTFSLDYSNAFDDAWYAAVEHDGDDSLIQRCFSEGIPQYSVGQPEAGSVIVNGQSEAVIGCEPLIIMDQIYGILACHETDGTLDTMWMNIISKIISTALINLQLYEQTNNEASENAAKLWAIKSAGELLSHMELDSLVVKIMELVLSIVSAQVGSIMLEENDHLVTRVEWGLSDETIRSIAHSSGVPLVEYVKQQKQPFLIEHPDTDKRVNCSKLSSKMDSLIVFPLYTNDRVLGVVNIVNPLGDEKFSSRDMDLVITMTNLLSISIENAMLYKEALEQERVQEQLNIARKIQQDLMPVEAPKMNGFSVDGINLMCDETGGDYFDYFSSNPEKFMHIVVGDVSGHGIGSALVMASARAHIRAFANNIADISQAIGIINNLMILDMEKNNQFMTLFLMTLDYEMKKIHYISAGHEIGLIYRPGEDMIIELESTGLPLGLVENAKFEDRYAQLQENDILFLYTDGIKEAMNSGEEMFGLDRIKQCLKKYSKLPVDKIMAAIVNDVTAFTGNAQQQDDWTLVVLKMSKVKKERKKNDVPEEKQSCNFSTETKEYLVKFIEDEPDIDGVEVYHRVIKTDLHEKEHLLDDIIAVTQNMVAIDEESSFGLRLCLDEALTNCVLHGNKLDPSKKVTFSLYQKENTLTFVVFDEGDGFDPSRLRNIQEPAPWFNENGRGVFLMKELMDDVIYFRSGRGVLIQKNYNITSPVTEETKMIISNPNCMVEEVNGIIKVSFKNNKILNESNIERIHLDILELIDNKPEVKLIIDFKNVQYLSSSVLSKLVSIHKKAVAQDGVLCLCSLDPVILKIFEITKLTKLFTILPDIDQAMEIIQN
ncbi:MAG: STAS domain-containing protein [Candidatus Auribacter fodinae]|jgi:sigma-B regulation protein RsbU (phosphoserine phosphatase)|uniref:STAS domain-containing protein n=1 Tax=Candidatus Auribacter fodinae TaxID=2093366 RepID=A0A3A4REB7_9BACT|nr:MAG: STAS domain-containing protein [Candidatus Auribacter fodinae]